MTAKNIVDSTSGSRRIASRTKSREFLLHSEERGIDERIEAQRKERAMDETLADTFPASDPPSWHS